MEQLFYYEVINLFSKPLYNIEQVAVALLLLLCTPK
jgi:hypothetical protein